MVFLSIDDRLVFFTLIVLVSGAFVSLMPQVEAPTSDGEDHLKGDVTLRVYPDESVHASITGSFTKEIEPWSDPPPFYHLDFGLAYSPAGKNLTEIMGDLTVKLGPEFTDILAALELDMGIHIEGRNAEGELTVKLPGTAEIDARIEFLSDEGSVEEALNLELTTRIWYAQFPKEHIEQLVHGFPMLKASLVSQVSEASDGSITIQDLTLVDSELGPLYATLTFTASVFGDFEKGVPALLGEAPIPYGDVPGIESGLDLEELRYPRAKSIDISVTYDDEEQAFTAALEGKLEGDLDRLYNVFKDMLLEESLLDPYMDDEVAQLIRNLLIPTEIAIVNTNTTFGYSLEENHHVVKFAMEGLELRPPDTGGFLTLLQYASKEAPQPDLNLILEGGSKDGEYVEINVPPTTSKPTQKEPQRAVWAFDDIENLDEVTFEVKKKQLSLMSPQVSIPVAAVAVAAIAGGLILARRI
jgi:hypothetical protein